MSVEPRRRSGRLPPIAYPLVAAAIGAALVWSFSRILLAVADLTIHVGGHTIKGKYVTAFIALLVALNILVGGAAVAYGRRVRHRPVAFPFLLGAAGLLIAGGVVALTLPAVTSGAEAQVERAALAAQNIQFQPAQLTLTAGAQVEVDFDNKDAGTQHNFHLFNGKDASSPSLYAGPLITGPSTVKYTFKAPPPGTYYFHCDVHPTQMTGTVTVSAGPAQAGGGGSPGPPGLTVTGKNIAFSPKQLQAPAGGQISIHFDNQDQSIQHNIVVYNGKDSSAPVLFDGSAVTGPGTADYTFPTPAAGTYFFQCKFHPGVMSGTLVVGGG